METLEVIRSPRIQNFPRTLQRRPTTNAEISLWKILEDSLAWREELLQPWNFWRVVYWYTCPSWGRFGSVTCMLYGRDTHILQAFERWKIHLPSILYPFEGNVSVFIISLLYMWHGKPIFMYFKLANYRKLIYPYIF